MSEEITITTNEDAPPSGKPVKKRATPQKPKPPGGKLTDKFIRDVRPPTREQRQWYYFENLGPGLKLSLTVGYGGQKTFRAHVQRTRNVQPVVTPLGQFKPSDPTHLHLATAKQKTWSLFNQSLPRQTDEETFGTVVENYLKAKVRGKIITARETERKLPSTCSMPSSTNARSGAMPRTCRSIDPTSCGFSTALRATHCQQRFEFALKPAA